MELMNFLTTADFLDIKINPKTKKELTPEQRITKIHNMIACGSIPRSALVPVGKELRIVKEKLIEHLCTKIGSKAKCGRKAQLK